MSKCSHTKCNLEVFKNSDKCILHCKKNDYSTDFSSGVLSDFYIKFINYIVNNLFRHNELLGEVLTKDDLEQYLRSAKFDKEEYNNIIKNEIFIPSCIHFPTRDGRDKFDYLRILTLFGEIHFNYCEFYLHRLKLKDSKCFFQDCTFHNSWILYNYKILENEDNVIYQTCTFNRNITNYTPDNSDELAIYDYSQFDFTCKFNGKVEFERVKFNEMLFNTNQYNYLDEQRIIKLKFGNCIFIKKFKLNNYDIDEFCSSECLFENKFEFKENKINKFNIYNSNFKNVTDLFGCEFIIFKIEKSIFDDFVGFESCTFGTNNKLKEEITLFKHTTFKNSLNARDSKFLSGLDIKNINLQGETNFLDAQIEVKNSNRETFRILKHSFDSIGNIIEANIYYQKEMQKRELELEEDRKIGQNLFEWLVFKIHGLASNHSQDWLLALFWILSFTFTFLTMEFVNTYYLTNTLEYILIDMIIFLGFVYVSYLIIEYEKINKFWYIGIYYIFYGFFSEDWLLKCFTNKLNPFSIMTGKEELNFGGLIYKIAIAYLIYQLIISIRQNTRRK